MVADLEMEIRPRTSDPATERVTAILSGGLPVRCEVLSTDPAAWNVTGARLPLLDVHRRDSIAAVIGHVENIHTDGGQIVADVTIIDERARSLVESGTPGISVRYIMKRWREDVHDGARHRVTTIWRLSEASLVPITADPGSGFGSDPMALTLANGVLTLAGHPLPACADTAEAAIG
jgi:hypothetical protein